MAAEVVGSVLLALPGLVIAWLLLWRRNRPVFWLAVVLLAVGIGYLNATGATADLARQVLPGLIKG